MAQPTNSPLVGHMNINTPLDFDLSFKCSSLPLYKETILSDLFFSFIFPLSCFLYSKKKQKPLTMLPPPVLLIKVTHVLFKSGFIFTFHYLWLYTCHSHYCCIAVLSFICHVLTTTLTEALVAKHDLWCLKKKKKSSLPSFILGPCHPTVVFESKVTFHVPTLILCTRNPLIRYLYL